MRKIFLSMFAVLVLAITALSCSDRDNDVTPNYQEQLLGKWYHYQEIAVDANDNVVSTYNEDNGVCTADSKEFKKGGVVEIIDFGFTNNPDQCYGETFDDAWVISGNTITIKDVDDDYENIYEIKKLTEDVFEMQRPLFSGETDEYGPNAVALKYVLKRSE